jgi:hypothetical protein
MASSEISPATRIRELSAINADIPAMLEAAGKAVNALTNKPLIKSEGGDMDVDLEEGGKAATIEERREVFTEQTKVYYTTLQAIVARLRRQAYALEEAGIIPAEAHTTLSSNAQRGQAGAAAAKESERITNGGLGNLDVGWLNSRGNKVGAEKESELVEEAKKLLEETLARGQNAKSGDGA